MLCYHITGIVSSRKLEIIFLCCALVLAAHCVQHFFIATQGLKSPKLLGTLAIKSAPGDGTVAIIQIPKGGATDEYHSS